MIDPIERLARDDKWQLGAGDGTLSAPVFPRWLDVPGFWDGASILRRGIAPLFTITILDDEGREIVARVTSRRWTPADLTLQYRLGSGITATEVRTVHPGGIFVSELRFAAFKPERIHLIAWTAQRASRVEKGSGGWNGALQFVLAAKTSEDDRSPLRVRAELACVGGAASWSAIRSEGPVPSPEWALTPFVEQWRRGLLPRTVRADADAPDGGSFFAAVHRTLDVEYSGASATFAMRVAPDEEAGGKSAGKSAGAPAGGRQLTFGGTSRKRWTDYFASLPSFRCSDPYFEALYRHRWYVLRMNANAPADSVKNAVGKVRELRWSGGAAPREILREFLKKPAAADWGAALSALDDVCPDDAFAGKIFKKAAAAADWLIGERDREASGLFDIARDDKSVELRVSPGGGGRIKGIESSVYAYRLFRWLERGARADDETGKWKSLADNTRDAIRQRMWNSGTGLFSDVEAKSFERANVKHARCFLPYGTDIANAEHTAGLVKHLLNAAEFFTEFPLPSLSLDDPRFSAEGEWKSRRAGEPWNGRTHPEITAEIVDAVAHAARAHAPELRDAATTLLRRFVRMMFHDGQLHLVNSFEHYNPITGHASYYRGVDDVQHAWLIDLIIRHVVGVNADDGGITIDPLPFGLEFAEITSLTVRGKKVGVLIEGSTITATIDEEKTVGAIGTPMFFTTPSKS